MFSMQTGLDSDLPMWVWNGLQILSFYLAAWVIHRLSGILAQIFLKVSGVVARNHQLYLERFHTLKSLLASLISFAGFIAATMFSLGLFVDVNTLVWVAGLFSAAFGLGARPLISDILTGFGFIFGDTFSVGEKVEILEMEGVIEAIDLRNTLLRSSTGELYIVPNGEIRTVRNFSRGSFSNASVTLKLPTASVGEAVTLLEALGKESVVSMPDLLEPWQVISSPKSIMGQQTELKIVAKARFGKAAETRPRMEAVIHERLSEHNISLMD